jgi:hypothetical protein
MMLVKFGCDCLGIELKLLRKCVGIFFQVLYICKVTILYYIILYYIILTDPLVWGMSSGSCNSMYITY